MRYPFLTRCSNGNFRRAGDNIIILCSVWNTATDPGLPMTDHEHKRANQYAKAIKRRMARLGFTYGSDWTELSNGMLWPMKGNK